MVCVCIAFAFAIVFVLNTKQEQISKRKTKPKLYHFIVTRARLFLNSFFSLVFIISFTMFGWTDEFTIFFFAREKTNHECSGNKMIKREIYTEHGLRILCRIFMICTLRNIYANISWPLYNFNRWITIDRLLLLFFTLRNRYLHVKCIFFFVRKTMHFPWIWR